MPCVCRVALLLRAWAVCIAILSTRSSGILISGLPHQAPCQVHHTEIVLPRIIITDTTAEGLPSPSFKPGTELPHSFDVILTWRGRHHRLTLHQSDVTSPKTVTLYEDEERNDTVAETSADGCQYQGFVHEDVGSFAAVSTCDGLAGFIQMGEDVLFIEPTPDGWEEGRVWEERLPHVMYTCTTRDASGANRSDTSETAATHKQSQQFAADDNTRARQRRKWGQRQQRERRRRVKRSLERRRYLEVQLVVDHTVVGMHGLKRVQHYVLTLMNIANSVYQHPSLGVNVRVVVTELVILQGKDQKEVLVKGDAFATVQKFCEWSNKRLSPASAIRHDLALLLTRENLGPAGYAPITGMCNPTRACATVTEEGFTSGFIIAHEMAHVFGLVHDGQGNSCRGPAYGTTIMAPLVEAKLNRFRWSECSRTRMQEIIPYLFCLNDNPDIDSEVDNHYDLDSGYKLPDDIGRHWSLNFQCRLEFGHRSRLCPAFRADACNVLWCSDSPSPYLCRTKRGPPMPGSYCGYNMECRDRRCESVKKDQAVSGHWGTWASWGDCSVKCGVGIKRRRRYCSNPKPAYGGRECLGEAESWDTCVAKDCREKHDMRAVQCAVWNDVSVRSGNHDWKPYPSKRERDQCRQTCVSSQTGEVVTRNVHVSDGTPCDYNNNTNICYQGRCLAVGCDGVQNSSKTFDSCGVCGGDHSECKTVSGHFTRQPSSGEEYEPVAFIPKGSRNIEIVKRGKDKHFIALRDPSDDSYPLNGDKKRQDSRQFIAVGARFDYERKFGYQSVRSPGPLYANLEVMLYPQHDLSEASVLYEYSVNKKDVSLEKQKYLWRYKEWSPCSVTCGEGVKTAVHACYDNDTGEERTGDMCQYLDPPQAAEAQCVNEPCKQKQFVWVLTDQWSTCKALKCGQEGVETQSYVCQAHYTNNDTYLTVDMQLCDPHTIPMVTRNCTAPPCDLTWSTGEWSECSVTCGQGKQMRSAYCGNPDTDSDDVWCRDSPPSVSRTCERKPCSDTPSGDECRDKFSTCPSSNGLGLKCHSQRFQDLCCKSCQRRSQQNAARRPRLSHRAIHKWVLTNHWSTCKADKCGEEGVETQSYRCQVYFRHNDTYLSVDMKLCDSNPAPVVTRKCIAPPCGMTWATGPWSECSATCGQGTQIRNVYCGDPDTDSDDVWCKDDTPPSLWRICEERPCKGGKRKRICIDKYSFCAHAIGLKFKCRSKQFRRICCKSCRRLRRATRKLAARKLAARKLAARKLAARKLAARKLAARKLAARQRIAKKLAAKRARRLAAKKPAARKLGAKKLGARNSTVRKPTGRQPAASNRIPLSQWDLYRLRLRRRRY